MEANPRLWQLGRLQVAPVDLAVALVLFATALGLRLPLLSAPVYGDEGLHFTIAKFWTAVPAGMTGVYNDTWWHPGHIFWQRPLYYVLMHIPAGISFEAMRVTSLLLVSAVPVVAYGMLGAFGVGRPARIIAGVVLASDPFLVQWTGILFMEGPLTLLVVGALWAWRTNHVLVSAGLFVAAAWTKETAVFVLLPLLVYVLVDGAIRRDVRIWPLTFSKEATAFAGALILAPLPVFLAFNAGLAMPGVGSEGAPLRVLDPLFWSIWLIPVLLWGLRTAHTRALSFLALAHGTFYLLWFVVLDRAVQSWYAVLPMVLSLVAVVSIIDHALARSAPTPVRFRARRMATAGAACLVVLVGIVGPVGDARDVLVSPVSHDRMTLAEVYHYENHIRDADLARAEAALETYGAKHVYVLDLAYGESLYPFVEKADRAWVGHTGAFETFNIEMKPVTDRIEANGTYTVVIDAPYPLNQALRTVYADCVVFRSGPFSIIEGFPDCSGRGAVVETTWHELRANAQDEK